MAETLTGLGLGQAVIMKRGVEVAVRVMVVEVVGQAVIWNRGVEVAVRVVVEVAVRVVVVDDVTVGLAVAVRVMVDEDVGGGAVGETEEASLPTVRSTPHTWGRDRVAE